MFLFAPLGRCFTTCPLGTKKVTPANTCVACSSNLLNCNASDGTEPANTADKIFCDSSCVGCVFDTKHCIACTANTHKLTPDRKCITTACPENTIEEKNGNDITCKECAEGCLKCAEESNTLASCAGGAAAKSKKCLRCDKDLGYYLYRDKCVKTCPVGTYADQVTGWCAECDCNCGSGGCVDRYICNACPNPKMALDPETGRCKCSAAVSVKWVAPMDTIEIAITTKHLKFRDLTAEAANAATNKLKRCRIGNEGSRYDSTSESVSKTDLQITRCGETANTDSELEVLRTELINAQYDSFSTADRVASSIQTNAATSAVTLLRGPSLRGQIQAQQSTIPSGASSTVQTITDATGKCPAHKTLLSKADLANHGLDSISNGFYKHVLKLDKAFGDVSIENVYTYKSPLDGLKFTSNPTDICSLLFDSNTLKNILDSPTCTLVTTATTATIKVKVGGKAQIYGGYALKFLPNVFVTDCDWPVLTTHKVDNLASAPATLDIKFDDIRPTIMTCEDYGLKLQIEGAVGKQECEVELESAYTDSGTTPLSTTDITNAKTEITTSNASFSTTGVYKITAAQLTKLKTATAGKIRIKAHCHDSYGQRAALLKEVSLSNGVSTLEIKNPPTAILYDSTKDTPVSFEFLYTNCGTSNAKVTYTTVLQKFTSGSFADVTVEAEKMVNNVIPKGLASTSQFQVKVTSSAPGITTPIVTNIPLQFITKKPVVDIKGIKTFVKASEVFTFKFDATNVSNVQNLANLGMSFSCLSCDSKACVQKDGTTALVIGTYYTASTHTVSIPADTLRAGNCYTIGITATYQGESGTSSVTVKVADASVTKALGVDFNFKESQFVDAAEPGHFECRPSDTTIQRANFKVDTISLLDSSNVKVTSA